MTQSPRSDQANRNAKSTLTLVGDNKVVNHKMDQLVEVANDSQGKGQPSSLEGPNQLQKTAETFILTSLTLGEPQDDE